MTAEIENLPALSDGAFDDTISFTFSFQATDVDEIDLRYRQLLVRLSRFKHLNEIHAPGIIVRNEERMLRDALDQLVAESASVGLSRELGFVA